MNDIKDKADKIVDKAIDEAETLAHNTAHPEDETRKEAKARQPWMPIMGAIIAGIILLSAVAYFIF